MGSDDRAGFLPRNPGSPAGCALGAIPLARRLQGVSLSLASNAQRKQSITNCSGRLSGFRSLTLQSHSEFRIRRLKLIFTALGKPSSISAPQLKRRREVFRRSEEGEWVEEYECARSGDSERMISFWMPSRCSISWLIRAAIVIGSCKPFRPVALITSARSCINLSSLGVNFESQNGLLIAIQSRFAIPETYHNCCFWQLLVAPGNY